MSGRLVSRGIALKALHLARTTLIGAYGTSGSPKESSARGGQGEIFTPTEGCQLSSNLEIYE